MGFTVPDKGGWLFLGGGVPLNSHDVIKTFGIHQQKQESRCVFLLKNNLSFLDRYEQLQVLSTNSPKVRSTLL